MRFTYSRWDGTQSRDLPDAEALMDALAESLLGDQGVESAVRQVIREGVETPEAAMPGLDGILEELEHQRRAELERYDLDSTMQDIRDRIEEVVDAERRSLDRMGAECERAPEGTREALESVISRRREALAGLSSSPAEAVTQLASQEPIDDSARAALDGLLEYLQRHVLRGHFQSMERMIGGLSGGAIDDFKDMLRALDREFAADAAGEQTDFAHLMERFGQQLPDANSLADLAAQMTEQARATEALLGNMSQEMRLELEATLRAVLRDDELRDLLGRVSQHVERLSPVPPPTAYPFSGEESVTLDEALRLMQRMSALDRLERQIRSADEAGDPDRVEADDVRSLLGEAVAAEVESLQQVRDRLIEAGFISSGTGGLEITARGMRAIGLRALDDIFSHVRQSPFGNHATTRRGMGGDRTDVTKQYEYGDQFLLDLNKTLMNAVVRSGSGTPLHLGTDDFEVFRTENVSRAATVLMLDLSRSMPLRGCFAAARKVTLALNALIRTRFPRDVLYVVGFSDLAREMRPESLYNISWSECMYGTNMQHGFMVARRLLGRHVRGTRQIIVITDGEPTAHIEDSTVRFAYPPTARTFEETLREVRRCTDEGIVINTFMLDRSHYLADFVSRMTRINQGRAFFATPDRLGDYILVDYVRSKYGAAGARV